MIATGFLALSRRYATAPFELWHLTLEDTIDTTGRAFLGLTLRCARCHDHKFDPVTQRDYYSLYGIFASTTFPYAGSEELHSKSFPRMNFVPTSHSKESQAKLEQYQETAGRARPRGQGTRVEERSRIQIADGQAPAEWSKLAPAVASGGRAGQLCGQRGKAGRRAASAARRPRQPGRRRAARRAAISVPGGGDPRAPSGPQQAVDSSSPIG